ncbi:hypothetical protein VCHENC02_0508B, partial [Vibrio harveyi]
RYLMRVDSSQY